MAGMVAANLVENMSSPVYLTTQDSSWLLQNPRIVSSLESSRYVWTVCI